jgi:hypothetical protein
VHNSFAALALLDDAARRHRSLTGEPPRAALSLLTDDAEELLGAVSGDTRGGRVVEAVVEIKRGTNPNGFGSLPPIIEIKRGTNPNGFGSLPPIIEIKRGTNPNGFGSLPPIIEIKRGTNPNGFGSLPPIIEIKRGTNPNGFGSLPPKTAAGKRGHKRRYLPFAALSLLTDDAEELLYAVTGDTRGGRVVEAVVDSGAVHSVTPPSCFPGRVAPSPWSRAGRGYRAANGTGIKNLGQVQVAFGTAEGHKCQIPFQVAEVEQPLLSVAHLTAAGNRVELGHLDGRVVNEKTGRTIALERRGGVYILKMFIADEAAPLPFRRQGA